MERPNQALSAAPPMPLGVQIMGRFSTPLSHKAALCAWDPACRLSASSLLPAWAWPQDSHVGVDASIGDVVPSPALPGRPASPNQMGLPAK